MNSSSARPLALASLLLGATAIGFAPLFVRLSEVGPSATAFYRLLLAQPLLWLWVALDQRRDEPPQRPSTPRDLWMLALTGLFFAGDMSLWHWSLHYTTVANSTLLTNFAPILVTIGARVLFGERITLRFVCGLAIALSGAIMLVGASLQLSSEHLLGDGIAVLTTTFYAAYLLSVSRLRRRFSAPTIMAWSGVISAPALCLVAWLSGEKMVPDSSNGWWVVAGLAVISHVGGQSLIAYGFGHLSASLSSVSLLWQPVVAALLAWMFLSEKLGWLQAAGAVVTLAGIAVATGFLARTRPPVTPSP